MSAKLRITFILPYAGISGGIRVIAIYAERLQARGHTVRVISTPFKPPGRLAQARCRVRSFVNRLSSRQDEPYPSHFHGLDVEHVQTEHFGPITNRDVPDGDVVVATWWETAPWVAALDERKGAKAYFIQDYGAHGGQPMTAVAQTWSLPMHKIAISKWLLNLIREHTGQTDVDLVPNAVDLEQFSAPPRGKQRQPTVGFLYNTAPQKGCDTILKAIEMVEKDVPNLHVVCFGPGDPAVLPLPAGVELQSCAPEDELKNIYSACDAWLFGSRSEGFGLPILEAFACRTPVIATPAGAAPELLAEGGGILVKPDDASSMAAAIRQVLLMPDAEWRLMSDAALATARRYSWNDATDLFEAALYRAVHEVHGVTGSREHNGLNGTGHEKRQRETVRH